MTFFFNASTLNFTVFVNSVEKNYLTNTLEYHRFESVLELKTMKTRKERIYWELRNGKIISDFTMNKRRLGTANLYDGKIKSVFPVKVNHILANRIRKMSNSEYVRYFGLVNRKLIK